MISGATLVSLGAASLAGMTAALLVWEHNVNTIEEHRDAINQGAEKTTERVDDVDQLASSDAYLKPLAITTGVLGVASMITGAALLFAGRKRARDVSVTPTLTPTFTGVTLSATF
jgi:hypothetical protein